MKRAIPLAASVAGIVLVIVGQGLKHGWFG